MKKKKTARNRLDSTRWQRFATRLRLSKLALAVAALACAKLTLLLTMGLRVPMAPPVQANLQANAPAHAQVLAVTAPAKPVVEAVRAAILDDSQALAAQDASATQQAPAAAQSPKPSQQTAPESVLSIQQLKARAESLDRQEQALKTLETDLNARVAKLKELGIAPP